MSPNLSTLDRSLRAVIALAASAAGVATARSLHCGIPPAAAPARHPPERRTQRWR